MPYVWASGARRAFELAAVDEPPAFDAVTAAENSRPSSPAWMVYELDVCPTIAAPSRYHW